MSHLGYGFVGWLILEISSGEKKKGPSDPDPQMNRKRGEGLSLKGERGVGLGLVLGGRLALLWKGENLIKSI